MLAKKSYVLGAILAASIALAAAAVACGDDTVAKTDFDKVQRQLSDQQVQNDQLQQQLVNLKSSSSATPAASGTAATAASSGGITWMLGAKAVPSPTAPPSPTPTPPGYTPPPKKTPPASYADPAGPFSFYVETLATTHQSSFNIAANIACSPSGVFMRGQRIVWRYEIIDLSTGKRVTPDTATSVKILLPNDLSANGSFSQRGGGQAPDAPWMWSSNWDIPLDWPLGGIDYKVQVNMKDGRTFTWAPPALIAKNLDEDTRPKVVQ